MPALRPAVVGALPFVLLIGLGAGCGTDGDLGARIVRTGPDAGPTGPTPTPSTAAVEPSAGTGETGSTVAEPCTGAQLAMSLGPVRRSDDGVAQDLILQNVGPAPCWVRGFPAVTAVTGNEGSPVGAQAATRGERGDRVRLAPRAAATVPLDVVDVDTYDAAVCRPVPVRGLRILPPGGSGAVFVPREGRACSAQVDALTPPPMTVGTAVAR